MSNQRRNALGRGLSALLENAGTEISGQENKPLNSISEIPISQVEANPFQPRTEFKETELKELSDSIKTHGVIQPITVRKIGFDQYQLISGERRTRAARMAGLTHIPAFIRLANDQEMLEMALIENIQREDLNAIEVSLSYKRLMEECSLNYDQLAERVGKNRSTVSNYLRLLNLPDSIQAAIRDEVISMGHARAIITIEDAEEQQYLFNRMVEEGLSVRAVENIVKQANEAPVETAGKKPTKKHSNVQHIIEIQGSLSKKFSVKVKIKSDERGRGHITIPFKSQQELNRLIELL